MGTFLMRWWRDNNFIVYRKDKIAVFIKLAILKYSHDVAYKNILQQTDMLNCEKLNQPSLCIVTCKQRKMVLINTNN